MTPRPYNDGDYRRAKAALKFHPQPCALRLPGCTITATTLDHQPRLTHHAHVRDSGCCRLIPACLHCNSSDGATTGNAKRASGYDWP